MPGTRRAPAAVADLPTEAEQAELEEAARAAALLEEAKEAGPDDRPIAMRMVAILAELPAIGKTTKNTEQGFMFRSHDAVLSALNPLLAKHGVVVVPDVLDRITALRETAKGKAMYEVNLHVRYRFIGLMGDAIEASVWGEGTDMGDKATNKAMTMAFKNVLAQAFSVSTEEFQDSDASTPEDTVIRRDVKVDPQGASPPANWSEAFNRFNGLFGVKGEAEAWLEELLQAGWGVMSLADVDTAQRREVSAVYFSTVMALQDWPGEWAFVKGRRAIIQTMFAEKLSKQERFSGDKAITLEGPAWALDGDEAAAGRPSQSGPIAGEGEGQDEPAVPGEYS